MSATELDEVRALLEHVLPDPTGYAQRLLMQAMTRWGQAAAPRAGAFYPPAQADVVDSDIVIEPNHRAADESPVDTNLLLAAALGACECWGLAVDCELCRGQGSAGWTLPDPHLFAEFIEPAIARLTSYSPGEREPGGANAVDIATNPTG